MRSEQYTVISGKEDDVRIESRILEERLQAAVADGRRHILVKAFGQHGIGGRLWQAGEEAVTLRIEGHPGQRVGSMGAANTTIHVMNAVSDDVGWLNGGATIVVHGNATNGVANAMAQGKIYIAGNIGARGMTMTKSNPRFAPPELWVLGSAGDYFGEFMAGGTAVVCGIDAQNPDNVLGYRPFVGMVGGKVFFRGPHTGFSEADATLKPVDDAKWQWLVDNLAEYLAAIGREELLERLSVREEWQLIAARTPQEKTAPVRRSMAEYHREMWDRELGQGGLIGDLTTLDRSPISLITTGDLRRYVPVWENGIHLAPCEASCPTGIPVQKRWQLIREGLVDEAVDMALEYTPFPATVCGYLCPNPCMQACTRQLNAMVPLDINQLGRASLEAAMPEMPPVSGKRIAVIGGGPAGISIAWQLRRLGHTAVVYDSGEALGGKMAAVIPESRIPGEVLTAEIERAASAIQHERLPATLDATGMKAIWDDFDYIVVAAGASQPRTLPVPGKEKLVTALDFLKQARQDKVRPGKRVIIIGAGNVGCDVATEASRLGAEDILLIDVQEPASFGEEREAAEKIGARFRWPCFTKAVTDQGVVLVDGELLPADTVIVSIGDAPALDFLPETVQTERGFIRVNEYYQTSDPRVFAIGDAVRPGLLTDAIGAGRTAAAAIDEMTKGVDPQAEERHMIDKSRVTLAYFDPRDTAFDDPAASSASCSSCGNCRDCGICVAVCPQAAISRSDTDSGTFSYDVDGDRCIGCGFCMECCPCGVWVLKANDPIG